MSDRRRAGSNGGKFPSNDDLHHGFSGFTPEEEERNREIFSSDPDHVVHAKYMLLEMFESESEAEGLIRQRPRWVHVNSLEEASQVAEHLFDLEPPPSALLLMSVQALCVWSADITKHINLREFQLVEPGDSKSFIVDPSEKE